MGISINCQYCNKYLICNHPTRSKFLWIFKRQCVIATGQLALGQRCDLQKVFPEPDILNMQIKRKRLKGIHQKICSNCYFYNENWEKEWNKKKYSWCNKKDFDILNDKESEKLGYCKYFMKKILKCKN